MNKVILSGNVGAKPEVKVSASGKTWAKISLATKKVWYNDAGEKVEKTDWHQIVCFGKTAENAAKYVKKGSKILIEGELSYSTNEKDGVKFYNTNVLANSITYL